MVGLGAKGVTIIALSHLSNDRDRLDRYNLCGSVSVANLWIPDCFDISFLVMLPAFKLIDQLGADRVAADLGFPIAELFSLDDFPLKPNFRLFSVVIVFLPLDILVLLSAKP